MGQVIYVAGVLALKLLIYVEEQEGLLKKKAQQPEEEEEKESELDQMAQDRERIAQENAGVLASAQRKLLRTGLLAQVVPLVLAVVGDTVKQYSAEPGAASYLQKVAVLTFGKFLCVDREFCEEHIETLFDLLRSGIDSTVKANVLITLGDLCKQFPNQLVPFNKRIFDVM